MFLVQRHRSKTAPFLCLSFQYLVTSASKSFFFSDIQKFQCSQQKSTDFGLAVSFLVFPPCSPFSLDPKSLCFQRFLQWGGSQKHSIIELVVTECVHVCVQCSKSVLCVFFHSIHFLFHRYLRSEMKSIELPCGLSVMLKAEHNSWQSCFCSCVWRFAGPPSNTIVLSCNATSDLFNDSPGFGKILQQVVGYLSSVQTRCSCPTNGAESWNHFL